MFRSISEQRDKGVGELLVQEDLARRLEMIAEGGSEALYRQASGGLFWGDGLEREVVEVHAPWSTTYRGCEVLQRAPVSRGFIILEELTLLEGFDLSGYHLHPAAANLMEAKKAAFGDRLERAGDPRFVKPAPLAQLSRHRPRADRRPPGARDGGEISRRDRPGARGQGPSGQDGGALGLRWCRSSS